MKTFLPRGTNPVAVKILRAEHGLIRFRVTARKAGGATYPFRYEGLALELGKDYRRISATRSSYIPITANDLMP